MDSDVTSPRGQDLDGNTDSIRVTTSGGVTLAIPAGLSKTQERGVDSDVSAWQGADVRVVVDEGPFSDPLDRYQDRMEHRLQEEEINGRPAQVVTFRTEDGGRFAGVHFPRSGGVGPVTVVVEAGADVDAAVPLAIARSVQF